MNDRNPGSQLRDVFDRAATIRVRNVLNPLLWLSAVATPTSFIAAWAAGFDTFAGVLLCFFGGLPVIATLVAYAGFALRDPDRLQSEEYRLRQRAIQLLYRKGGSTEIVDVVTSRPTLEIEHKSQDMDQ